jgi:hypothetical protein
MRGAAGPILGSAVALLLVACGTAAPTESPIADVVCPEVPDSSAQPNASRDPELAARIPAEIGDQPFPVQTWCASEQSDGLGANTSPDFLATVGVDLTDVTMAAGPGPEIGASAQPPSLTAFRYRGAEEATLRDAFLEVLAESGAAAETGTIGGKEVTVQLGSVIYVQDDTIYLVSGDGPSVEELLNGLP